MQVNLGPVLMVTPRWTRDGGVATHVMASAAALGAHDFEVHIAAARIGSEAVPPGVTVHHCPDLFNERISPAERLAGAMSCTPAVIHLHQFDDPDVVAFMRTHAPVLISTHGYTACTSGVHYFAPGQECSRPHGPGCVPNLIARGCAHTRDPRTLPPAYRRASRALRSLRQADLAISYSSAVDRHLEANGLPRRRVIPLFTTMDAKVGHGHDERRRVVFAGRVVAPKGVDVLIRAAAEVDGEFVICGDGWRLEATRRLARRLGVLDRVRFTGWLSAEDLAHELAEASVVTIPSVWPEPFGLVGIEALAAGRPVVASATGGVGDWLEDGVNGMFVAPGDAPGLARTLNELLADPSRQRALGEAGRQMVARRFSPGQHVDALREAYRSVRSTWVPPPAGAHQHDARGQAPAAASRV